MAAKRPEPWWVHVAVEYAHEVKVGGSVGYARVAHTWRHRFEFEARESFERYARGDVLSLLAAVRPASWLSMRERGGTSFVRAVVSYGARTAKREVDVRDGSLPRDERVEALAVAAGLDRGALRCR